ncbi:MAG: dihydroxyacetone kinase subunit L [Treponema sp.]|jgi:dihydroxyacetone kinase|nr:dihydroxyacetone kinase subunit L [Treponema sp.]
MNVQSLAGAFGAVSAVMDKNRDYLIQLDQQNGDGDLGISMSSGFRAVKEYLSENTGGERDLGRLLMKSGSLFNEAAPSSLGTIISMGMMGMARSLKGKEEAGLADLAAAMEAGLASIMEKAKSKPGEKTVLDALCPGVEALKKASGGDIKGAFAAAAAAAAEGSENTKNMKAVHGRAAFYGEKSIGVLDGGSVAGKLIFEGLNQYAGGL